jgi:transglutaminase-like putative cysteine protease
MGHRIDHLTEYRFAAPVRLGPHRLMLRPRDSFDLRVVDARLLIEPHARLTWSHDVYGNAICLADFTDVWTDRLIIRSLLDVERFGSRSLTRAPRPWIEGQTVAYAAAERAGLMSFLHPVDDDPLGEVRAFALAGVAEAVSFGHPLLALMHHVHARLSYQERHEPGTQVAIDTLSRQTGACRDYAWLFIECARHLGYAARFVSGYVGQGPGVPPPVGGGYTHAFADVFVPGDGWVEFDPTNLLCADPSLLRNATVRVPAEATPISGGYFGTVQAVPPLVRVFVEETRRQAA